MQQQLFYLPGGGGGKYTPKNWVGVCGPLLKTLTLFMTKICDFSYHNYKGVPPPGSNWAPLLCGVPQGSLLSPYCLTFLLTISMKLSMPLLFVSTQMILYPVYGRQCKSPIILQFSLNRDAKRISSWTDHNYLQANGDKTQGMVLGKCTLHYDFIFNGSTIGMDRHGINLDNKLSLIQHVNLFKPRITHYNIRNSGINVVQNSYNSRFSNNFIFIRHISNVEPTSTYC